MSKLIDVGDAAIAEVEMSAALTEYILRQAGGAPTMLDAIRRIKSGTRAAEDAAVDALVPLLGNHAAVSVSATVQPAAIRLVLDAYVRRRHTLTLRMSNLHAYEATVFDTPPENREPLSLSFRISFKPLLLQHEGRTIALQKPVLEWSRFSMEAGHVPVEHHYQIKQMGVSVTSYGLGGLPHDQLREIALVTMAAIDAGEHQEYLGEQNGT